ncbi:uncharacterized protein LOC117598476 [Pangasianodon hypophthalmus]|uniref:uncharacterized protein LOC117598476 n=1 Tax=Pangasianodon hypophthalmus TaxID=310915 RepID=UPI00230735F9|nr:uncharacterized protein LOC117598476 [Pangasianodon hypophthalmus]
MDHSTQNTRKKDHKVTSGNSMKETGTNKINLQTQVFGNYGPEKPGRFVSEDFRKVHTDDIEALAWALFYNRKGKASQELKHPVRSNNDRYIIYDLQLEWVRKNYNWKKFELFNSKNDINHVLDLHCYDLQCSEDIQNVIVHYASVGEKDPKYLMVNGWIYKLYPKKLYIFLVGKRLRTEENADEIKKVIDGQYKKYEYKHIREGISNCKENNQNLYDVYAEYAQYTRDTFQGIYTRGTFDPIKEAWFTTYFLATVISESARNFRSFVITLMALDLSLSQNPEKAKQEIFLEKLPMVKGGSWINTNRRGFHGASSAVNGKKTRLKRLIEEEEEIFKKWLSGSSKTSIKKKIDRELIKHLLELLFGKIRLSKHPSLLEDFITNYVHFKKEINSLISPELLRGSHGGPISLKNNSLSCCLSSIIPTTTKPRLITLYPHDLQLKSFFISLMYNYSSDSIQNQHLYLYSHDLDRCRDESRSPLMPSVQTLVSSALLKASSKISINPDVLSSLNMWVLFHQHFSTDPADLSLGLWKKRGILLFTDQVMADMLICLHLNQIFSTFIPLKGQVYRDTVKQQCLIFPLLPSENLLSSLLKRPHEIQVGIEETTYNATYKITHSTSLDLSGASSLYILTEHWEQREITFLDTCWGKELQLHNSSFIYSSFTQFHRIHLLADYQ